MSKRAEAEALFFAGNGQMVECVVQLEADARVAVEGRLPGLPVGIHHLDVAGALQDQHRQAKPFGFLHRLHGIDAESITSAALDLV